MTRISDSVSIFAEGTFEEQILELLSYLVRNLSEEERTTTVAQFQDLLKSENGEEGKRKDILSKLLQNVKGLGDGSDKEIEGFFNLIFAHIFALHHPDSPEANEYVKTLMKVICGPNGSRLACKYRILSNLFNTLPRTSSLRHLVYQSLLSLAVSNENLDELQLQISVVEKWLTEWEIPATAKASFVKSITDAYTKAKQDSTAYEYFLLYVKNLEPSSQEAQAAALQAISLALRLSKLFDFDPLLRLDAILALKNHELLELLQIFLKGGLPEFRSWESRYPKTLEQHHIPPSQLEQKIRLLTLASLAFEYVGQSLPYTKIAQSLQVEVDEVEKWAIDVICAGLVSGKLSQTTQSMYVIHAISRNFEQGQWRALEQRLTAWKTSLANILDVVTNAKKMGTQVAVPT